MILSVLSGEKSVTQATEEADITRALYYQIERRALEAMIEAVTPKPPGRRNKTCDQIQALQAQIETLEKDKRRAERLLFLTRKVLKRGPLSAKKKKRTTSSGRSNAPDTPSTSSTPTKPSATHR